MSASTDQQLQFRSDAQEQLITSGALNIINDSWARLILKRRTTDGDVNDSKYVLWYQMQRATDVHGVGHQLWGGGLLLIDYLLSAQLQFERHETAILELGCGVGIASILAPQLGAKQVFATDVGQSLLRATRLAVKRNHCASTVTVRELDWCKHEQLVTCMTSDDTADDHAGSAADSKRHKAAEVQYMCTEDWQALLAYDNVVVMAADVAYVDEWTSAFAATLRHILGFLRQHGKEARCYLTAEKRINFSAERLEVCSPTYEALEKAALRNKIFQADRLPTTFESWAPYERTDELELWRIQLAPSDSQKAHPSCTMTRAAT
eukprot:TRINITY_DN12335_c0_g1_i6.p1 TRINITY_DN12335_c0_g1~~TRINITY_DN12335_c0_g1_i6.p1  ORF type:complete len:321 (+),score=34.68 TRINITY_DN12335_c0_g1_i6:1424-2386(+)